MVLNFYIQGFDPVKIKLTLRSYPDKYVGWELKGLNTFVATLVDEETFLYMVPGLTGEERTISIKLTQNDRYLRVRSDLHCFFDPHTDSNQYRKMVTFKEEKVWLDGYIQLRAIHKEDQPVLKAPEILLRVGEPFGGPTTSTYFFKMITVEENDPLPFIVGNSYIFKFPKPNPGGKSEIFAINNISEPLLLSKRVVFDASEAFDAGYIKSYNEYTDTFMETVNKIVINEIGEIKENGTLNIKFRVLDMGIREQDTIHFVMMQAHTNFITVNTYPNIVAHNTNKRSDMTTFAFIKLQKGLVNVHLKLYEKEDNTRDVNNLRIGLWNDEYIEPKVGVFLRGDNPEHPAHIRIKKRETLIYIPSLHLNGPFINIVIRYTQTNLTLNHIGLKSQEIALTIFYDGYNEKGKKVVKKSKPEDNLKFNIATKHFKGMRLILPNDALCLGSYSGSRNMRFSHDCATFYFSLHQIKNEYDWCIGLEVTTGNSLIPVYRGCEGKRTYWERNMIRFYGDGRQDYFDSIITRGKPTDDPPADVNYKIIFERNIEHPLSYDSSEDNNEHMEDGKASDESPETITTFEGSPRYEAIDCYSNIMRTSCLSLWLHIEEFVIARAPKTIGEFTILGYESDTGYYHYKHKDTNNLAYGHRFWLRYNKHRLAQAQTKTSYHPSLEIERDSMQQETHESFRDEFSNVVLVGYLGKYANFANRIGRIIWPASPICDSVVGKYKKTSVKNCDEMRHYCPRIQSGIYWIGVADFKGKVYCSMELEGTHGWTLISRVTQPEPDVAFQHTSVIWDVVLSNFTKSVESTFDSFLAIRDNLGIGYDIRIYCSTDAPGRTFHVRTYQSHRRTVLYQYLHHGKPSAEAKSEYLFLKFNDDNSILSNSFDKTGYPEGTLGYLDADPAIRIYDLVFISSKNSVRHIGDVRYCDNVGSPVYKNAKWEIYLL